MGKRYDGIKKFEDSLFNEMKSRFSKECLLFEEMSELILDVSEPYTRYREVEDEGKTVCVLLHTRMFNDFEASKLLLLYGFPEPARMPIRDSIECMLLIRLFLNDATRARRWVNNCAQYSPGDVNAELTRQEVYAIEYEWYGLFSHLGHTNMLASATCLNETLFDDGSVFRTFCYGGRRDERVVPSTFLQLLLLMYVALTGPLFQMYKAEEAQTLPWTEKLKAVGNKLHDLVSETTKASDGESIDTDIKMQNLIGKKLKIDNILRLDIQ